MSSTSKSNIPKGNFKNIKKCMEAIENYKNYKNNGNDFINPETKRKLTNENSIKHIIKECKKTLKDIQVQPNITSSSKSNTTYIFEDFEASYGKTFSLLNNGFTQFKNILSESNILKDTQFISLLEQYKISCKKIIKKEILFNDYFEHIQVFHKIWSSFIDLCTSSNFLKKNTNFHILLYGLDNTNMLKFGNYYNNNKNINVKHYIDNNLEKDLEMDLSNEIKITSKNRQYISTQSNFRKALKLRMYSNDKTTINQKYLFKEETIIPTYTIILLQESRDILNVRAILNDINILRAICDFFIKDIDNDYVIINKNDTYNNIKNKINNENITRILINNKYLYDNSEYYYHFKFNGPKYNLSHFDSETFTNYLKQYQPLGFNDTEIHDIDRAYKSTSTSKLLNINSRFFLDGYMTLLQHEDVYKRFLKLIQYFNNNFKNTTTEDITLYHGTNSVLHHNDTFELKSFLSLTANLNTALHYATVSLSKKTGIIYIISVKNTVKYINLKDPLLQIVLPPYVKIKVKNEINIQNIKYFICETIEFKNDFSTLIDKIKENEPLYDKNFDLKPQKYNSQFIKYDKIGDDFNFDREINNRYNMTITQYTSTSSNQSFFCTDLSLIFNIAIPNFFQIKYTIHQCIINSIYHNILKDNQCIKYDINYIKERTRLQTCWIYDRNYGRADTNFRYHKHLMYNFLIDCFMSNWDCYKSENYIKILDEKKIDENNDYYKRVLFTNCGLYTFYGQEKPTFNNETQPYEYISLIQNIDGFKDLLNEKEIDKIGQTFIEKTKKLNINDITTAYNNFIDLNIDKNKYKKEYDDLKKMISHLDLTFKYRFKFFNKNFDTIKSQMKEFISIKGGKSDIMKNSSKKSLLPQSISHKNIQIVNKQQPSSSSHKSKYDVLPLHKIINLPTSGELSVIYNEHDINN